MARRLRLFVVVAIAIFVIMSTAGRTGQGAPDATTTTSSPVPTTIPPTENTIPLLSVDCSHPGLGGFGCDNLARNDETEYQMNWIQRTDGERVTIRLAFFEPTVVTKILWRNIADPVRFHQNYRVQSLLVSSEDGSAAQPISLNDAPGLQQVLYSSARTEWIEIEVASAYLAQVIEDNVYGDLAIVNIEVLGWPYG